jgi:hypothetical protein
MCCEGPPGAEDPGCVQHLLRLDTPAGPQRLGARNTTGTPDLNPTSWWWQSTDPTTTIMPNCMTIKMIYTKPHYMASPSKQRLRLSSIPTTRTTRMAWSQAGQVKLSCIPSDSIANLTKVVKMLTALFRTNSCVLLHASSFSPHSALHP